MAVQLDIISIDGSIRTLFAVDIGNSAIKFYSKGMFFYFSYKQNWELEVETLLGRLSNQNVMFAISSVNPEKEEFLLNKIEGNIFFSSISINEILKKQKIIDKSKVEGIGNDRVLGLIGGLNYHPAPLITIDMGTATTINIIAENNVILGGAILPGIFTQFRSLIEHTSALKKIHLEPNPGIIGKNTNEAISSGIINGMFGTVSYFIHTLREEFGFDIPVMITGGNSGWIVDKLISEIPNVKHIPTLVLEGIIISSKSFL